MKPNRYQLLNIDDIDEPATQIRQDIDPDRLRELASSIAAHGVLQPVEVRHHNGRYQIIAGHRRYLASRIAKRTRIPAIVTTASADTAVIHSLHENLFRHDPTDHEYATTFAQLISDERFTTTQIATSLGRSEEFVRARLRILAWPQVLIDHLKHQKISLSAASELSRISDDTELARLLDYAAANGITARTASSWAQTWEATRAPVDPSGVPPGTPIAASSGQPMMYPCYFCSAPTQLYSLTVLRSCGACLCTMAQAGSLPLTKT